MNTREVAVVWGFGTSGVSNNLGSTGAIATPYNTFNQGEQFTFMVSTDGGATCSYQIRSGPTAAGPFSVLSSGTLATGATDIVQLPGPLGFLSPRIKTMTSTSVGVVVRANAL
jgi:hypothetical protein